MTCLRKRRFPNPIKDSRRTNYDKFMISGSCGHCSGCKKQKQNDWLVRSYFEFMSKDFDAFFVTLDFDDAHLPTYNGVPCFDSELMHSFFDGLRYHFGTPFRYLYSTHHGDALGRPHYHVAFLFDKGSITVDRFYGAILKKWIYGSHTRIDLLRSVRGNPLAAFEYICKYTTSSRKFNYQADKVNMPIRYRMCTKASIGFGAQALDPKEFNSARFLKQGISFREHPVITREYLLNNSVVYLDIKNDGVLVPFAVPMYYYYKLFYTSHYDPETKRTTLERNHYFEELQVLQHNAHYIHLYESFVNSRNYKIHNDLVTMQIYEKVFPDSPYLGVMWSDVVDDVLKDEDAFFDFCKVYSHLKFDYSQIGYNRYRPLRFSGAFPRYGSVTRYSPYKEYILYFDPRTKQLKTGIKRLSYQLSQDQFTLHGFSFQCSALDGTFNDASFDGDIDYYIYAMSLFQIWQDVDRYRKADIDDWKEQEQIKEKIKTRAKHDRGYYFHLRRKKFKFYTLNPQSFSSYVSLHSTNPNRV